MSAVHIREPGGPETLVLRDTAVPEPGPFEILVKVFAAGVNRPDVLQRMGLYPAPAGASEIPGLEIAGEIVARGENAQRYLVGDKVCGLATGGGYGQFCVLHEACALPVPGDLSMVEAAALPETFFTVWHNVFERGDLKAGEVFLVHGGSSGIGTTAIQLAHAFGAQVFATAGSKEKCQACLSLGADMAINYREEDFVEVVKASTDGHGADVILDMVGGDYIQRNIKAAAMDARLVQIAFLKGAKVDINLMPLMLKRLTLTGSTLRARSVAFKKAIATALQTKVWPLIESGSVKPVIDTTYPLSDAAAAHAHMETNRHIGKIVLTMD